MWENHGLIWKDTVGGKKTIRCKRIDSVSSLIAPNSDAVKLNGDLHQQL